MKTKFKFSFLLLFISGLSFSQTNWETEGNAVSEGDWLGTTNYEPLIFKTNNTQWAKFGADGKLYFDGQAIFNSGIYSDSIKVVKYLDVDSIHCRTIKVGNSLTTNDAGPTYGGSRPYDQQLLNASNGSAVFESGNIFSNVTDRDNPKVVIGYVSSANGVFHKLNLHSNTSSDVFSSFTNRGLYSTDNSLIATNGFKVGIKSTGVAEINQQENLDMNFLTNNNQRMVIKNAGNVGINTTTPNNKLEITQGTSGNSGLRFTNLTNSSSSITNTTDKILSVNSSGDVILVDDKQGAGGGGVNYCIGVANDFLMKKDASTNNLCVSGVYEVPSGTYINNIGIGSSTSNNLRSKLNVNGNTKIGSGYVATTTNAPTNGLLVEGNTGIGRSNGSGLTVDARLHVNTDASFTTTPSSTQRNFFLGTASDRSGYKDVFTMFTTGTNGNETATIQAVGRSGEGRIEALVSNSGVRLTSGVNGSNVAGIEPVLQSGNRLALGGDTIFPNTTSTGLSCFTSGPIFGDATHQWGRVWSHEIRQAESNNPIFMRIRPGNIRDDSRYNCALVIQGAREFSTASYLKIIGTPSTFNTCNNNYSGGGFSSIVPVFEVAANGNVGIKGFVPSGINGLWVNGDITVTGSYLPSDERIKKNITEYHIGLDALRKVNVKTYQYKNKIGITDTVSTKVGVIAQELMQVLPNAVDDFLGKLNNPSDSSEADQTIMRIDQNVLLFTTINAVKELDTKNQVLETKNQELTQALEQQSQRIDEILQRLEQCCRVSDEGNRSGQINQNDNGTENNSEFNSLKVELSNSNQIVLNQNEPNPFKDKTTIRFTIPNEVKQAEIIFFDQKGSIIKTILIESRGTSQLEVYSSNLSVGTYSYSLVADGISIDTKKMVNIK